jgi:hypothetical protein
MGKEDAISIDMEHGKGSPLCVNCKHPIWKGKEGWTHERGHAKSMQDKMLCDARDSDDKPCDCPNPQPSSKYIAELIWKRSQTARRAWKTRRKNTEYKTKYGSKEWRRKISDACLQSRKEGKGRWLDPALSSSHCRAITRLSKKQCLNGPKPNSLYCGLHTGYSAEEDKHDPRSKQINGKYNPYNSGKEPQKASRWRYWMSHHGCEPPEDKFVSAKKMGLAEYEHDKLSPAQKAWVTRRKNNPKLTVTKDYDAPKKNAFRTMIARSFSKIGGTCLALESPDFYFAKELPELKFVIFENNEVQHRKMRDNAPPNVKQIYFADVKEAPELAKDETFTCAFLDYCNSFQKNETALFLLKEKLSSCKKIALTFALRSVQWDTKGDYSYELAQKLLNIFTDYEIEYGDGYHDTTTMVGLLLVRKDYKKHKRARVIGPKRQIAAMVPLETKKKIQKWADEHYWKESEVIRRILMAATEVN